MFHSISFKDKSDDSRKDRAGSFLPIKNGDECALQKDSTFHLGEHSSLILWVSSVEPEGNLNFYLLYPSGGVYQQWFFYGV
jgi:hypothetical protein